MPEPQAASAAVRAKASRLLAEQKVLIGIAGYVRGDTGDYVVSLQGGVLSCSCPARIPNCAHAEAVARLLRKAKEQGKS
jgi:hypothetical protein